MTMDSKKWYTSKTVWFNILTIGGAVLSGAAGLLPLLELHLTAQQLSLALFSVGLGNVVLRSITTGPINWKEDEPTED